VTTRGRGKLQGSINTSDWLEAGNSLPSVPSATSAISSRSQDDVHSDISRFKLLLPLRPKVEQPQCGFQLSEQTKSPAWSCERPFLPCIENLALHRIFLGGELRQRAHSDQTMVPAPRWIMTTRSTGKAWFYLSRLRNALPLLLQFQPYRIFASF
jgi:hypothetical protein